jgi:hypothetical protein
MNLITNTGLLYDQTLAVSMEERVMQYELTLYSMGYGCYPMGKQCRSRSSSTSVLSDQDLNCLLCTVDVNRMIQITALLDFQTTFSL